MVLCENCSIACDFCIDYEFNGDEDGAYMGEGYCNLHKRQRDPGEYCNDFYCMNAGKKGDAA